MIMVSRPCFRSPGNGIYPEGLEPTRSGSPTELVIRPCDDPRPNVRPQLISDRTTYMPVFHESKIWECYRFTRVLLPPPGFTGEGLLFSAEPGSTRPLETEVSRPPYSKPRTRRPEREAKEGLPGPPGVQSAIAAI